MFVWIVGLLLGVLALQLLHTLLLRCLMATAAEVNAKLDRIETNIGEIGDDLQEVIEKLPSEGGMTAEEVAALSERLSGLEARTRTIAVVVPEPAAPTE